jgi:hypothetical protein
MKKKYAALRTIGTIYKIIGIVIAIITVLGSIGICIMGFASGSLLQSAASSLGSNSGGLGGTEAGIAGIFAALWTLVAGAISAVTMYALGEGVYLLLDLEENTRKTAELLVKE